MTIRQEQQQQHHDQKLHQQNQKQEVESKQLETSASSNHPLRVIEISANDDDNTRHWKSNHYAVGLVEIDWKWQRFSRRGKQPVDATLRLSNLLCCCFGRRGNMVVMPGPFMLGPYWPIMLCVTLPLVLGVSFATAFLSIRKLSKIVISLWSLLTGILILSLLCVGCRNPGIMNRHLQPESPDWIWNDQALTYRPTHAKYDSECACVIEGFDHTCPWTGTAIAKKNMLFFRVFVALIFAMIFVDIAVLTLGFLL
jgi:hypothetical protein